MKAVEEINVYVNLKMTHTIVQIFVFGPQSIILDKGKSHQNYNNMKKNIDTTNVILGLKKLRIDPVIIFFCHFFFFFYSLSLCIDVTFLLKNIIIS